MKYLSILLFMILVVLFSSCTKNYSCYCVNEFSMAAVTPSKNYMVNAKTKKEARDKCDGLREYYRYWTSCTLD